MSGGERDDVRALARVWLAFKPAPCDRPLMLMITSLQLLARAVDHYCPPGDSAVVSGVCEPLDDGSTGCLGPLGLTTMIDDAAVAP